MKELEQDARPMRYTRKPFRFLQPFDDDPLSSTANLVDVMLVFACGLLCALVAYLQLDIFFDKNMTLEEKRVLLERLKNMKEISNLEKVDKSQLDRLDGGEGFQEIGAVFVDPKTGKMMMVENSPQGP